MGGSLSVLSLDNIPGGGSAMPLSSNHENSQTSLVVQWLLDLCHEHNRLAETRSGDILSVGTDNQDSRLQYLKSFPVAYSLVNCISYFSRPNGSSTEMSPPVLDPTLFPLILQAYHKGVIQILAQSSSSRLSQEELAVFKEEFGPSAFVCDIRGCERSVVGYASANRLKDHEARHQGRLKCPKIGCSYDQIGSTSLKQLRNHERKLHTAPTASQVPQRIPRKRPTEPEIEENHEAGKNFADTPGWLVTPHSSGSREFPSDAEHATLILPEQPEPLPLPAKTSFNLAQPQLEGTPPTKASAYWSVSESNDFPHLLRAFGSDWTAIAAHMGSKTAVMVKNFFVRQKDQESSGRSSDCWISGVMATGSCTILATSPERRYGSNVSSTLMILSPTPPLQYGPPTTLSDGSRVGASYRPYSRL
ncbi:hypothetical protein EDB80DRAFT_685538 [Ilyonectria destructans]|nr:hypothetical protein EDB80DRAFT_685538 [Ilyonectria destructans]